MNKENKLCERCHKIKQDVRFESLTESYICDTCVKEFKEMVRNEEI